MLKSDLILYCLYCLLALISSASAVITIKELKIPSSVESGTVKEIILDCDYIADKETGVVVKWFYNGGKDQIYQWIPGQNKSGFPMGSLKNNIDETYKASDEATSMYRALKLVNVSHQLTGSYSCKVTGDTHETVQTKKMTIFVPPAEGLNLTINQANLTAICTANGVFPEPTVSLYLQEGTNWNRTNISSKESLTREEGLFNKEKILSFSNESVVSPCQFVCEMSIPGTEYGVMKTKKCSLDNSSTQPHLSAFSLHSSLLLILATMVRY